MPLVIDRITCLPAAEATVYATSLSRPASGSHSKVAQELLGVAGLLNFFEERGIDFAERVRTGTFLAVSEVDGLVIHLSRQEEGKRPSSVFPRQRGERTVVLRVRAAQRFLDHLVGLHSHGVWLSAEERLDGNAGRVALTAGLTARAPTPRSKEGTRRGLTPTQDATLFSALVEATRTAVQSGNDAMVFAADRNLLWFDWASELGLRTGELLGLRLCDLDFGALTCRIVRRPDASDDPRRDLARVKGEGRELDLSPRLAARTREYVEAARDARPGARCHTFLFVSLQGAPWSRSGVNKMFRVLRRVHPELGERFCNHVLRHSWNDRFSDAAARADLTSDEEADARAYAQGWSNPTSARPYLLARVRRRAAEVSRLSQERQMAVRSSRDG